MTSGLAIPLGPDAPHKKPAEFLPRVFSAEVDRVSIGRPASVGNGQALCCFQSPSNTGLYSITVNWRKARLMQLLTEQLNGVKTSSGTPEIIVQRYDIP